MEEVTDSQAFRTGRSEDVSKVSRIKYAEDVDPVHALAGQIGALDCPHAGTRQIACSLDPCLEVVLSIQPTFCPFSIGPWKRKRCVYEWAWLRFLQLYQ